MTIIILSATLVAVASGFVVYFKRQRASNESVLARELYFRSLIENATDLITVLSQDGTIIYESPSSKRVLGSPEDGLRGKNALDFIHSDDRERVENKLAIAFAQPGTTHTIEFRFRHHDGGWIYIESTGRVNSEHISPPRVILNSRDITERKKNEQELGKLEDQLRHAHKMDALGTMAGGIAHDFNNVLAAILGYSEMLRDGLEAGNPEMSDLDQILSATRRAKDLVDKILAFSRRSTSEKRPVKLDAIVKEAAGLLRASIPATVEIQTTIGEGSAAVNADPGQIHQVLMNLGTNAGHAMKETGGILHIELDTVDFEPGSRESPAGLEHGHYCTLRVTDSGTGIFETDIERIYDPFFTTKPVGSGTGLGLSVVHGIIAGHDGRIFVNSEIGKGTSFTIYLRRVDGAVSEPARNIERMASGTERIMVIDDEEPIVRICEKTLVGLGYHVTSFSSSVEAVDHFGANKEGFDLVLTDLTMPGMAGTDVARAATDLNSDLPVVLMTGFGQTIDSAVRDDVGIVSVLQKPFVKQELAAAVRAALDRED